MFLRDFFQTESGGWPDWEIIRNFGWVENLGGPGLGCQDCSIYKQCTTTVGKSLSCNTHTRKLLQNTLSLYNL